MTDRAPLIDCCCNIHLCYRGARWLSGRASDSGARRQGLETYLRRVVSLSKILYSPKVPVIHRKRWLRPDMTGKLLTGTLSQHKQTDEPCHENTNVLVSDLVRHKPGCTATEDGLRLEISDLESRSYYICSEGSAMA